jgi:hypothetical protein
MKKLSNPFGDKGGRLLSAIVANVNISMKPGEDRLLQDDVAYQAKNLYPFLILSDVEEQKDEEIVIPNFDGEKKKRRSFLSL